MRENRECNRADDQILVENLPIPSWHPSGTSQSLPPNDINPELVKILQNSEILGAIDSLKSKSPSELGEPHRHHTRSGLGEEKEAASSGHNHDFALAG